ncbi:MAG: hypothetical protein RCG15_06085 [Candidatus Rickettsia vulgarisii]
MYKLYEKYKTHPYYKYGLVLIGILFIYLTYRYFLLAANVNKQAFVIAINNIFGSISLLFVVMMMLLPFLSNINVKNEEMNAH